MALYHIIVTLNVWASGKLAAYMFTDARLPVVARIICLSRLGTALGRLEVWLYDLQYPCEVPF